MGESVQTEQAAAHVRLGQQGEDLAARYLSDRGYRVVDRNWRCGREGEIDIVALAPRPQSTLVVIEVKTRAGVRFGEPIESITFAKAMRLRRLASAWCEQHSPAVRRIRIDAIGVLMVPGEIPQIQHVEDAT